SVGQAREPHPGYAVVDFDPVSGAVYAVLLGLSNAGPYAATTNVADGDWHHLAASYEAGVLQIWVDGTLEFERTGLTGLIHANSGSDTWMGARTNGSRYLQGTLDEVRLYSYALSPAEVATLSSATENGISCQEPNSLVGYWAMEDVSTTTVFDSAQNQAGGSLLNGAIYGPGQTGNGILLDGIDDGIDLGDNAWDLGPQDAFTWSLWVEPNNFNNIQSLLRRITNGRSIRLQINRSGYPRLYLGGLDYPGWHIADFALNAGEWNHVVFTYENGTLTWQINGVAGTPVTGLTGAINLGSGYTLAGRRNNNRRPRALGGAMDEIRFYNYALSSTEMNALYTTMPSMLISSDPVSQPVPLQAVSHYAFNDCASAEAKDTHLINHGAPAGTARTAGHQGGGMAFSGNNSHINLGNNASLNFEGQFSFSLWVNTTVNREQDILVAKNKVGDNHSYMLANRYGYPALFLGSQVKPVEWISTERYIADGQWHHLAVVIGKGTAYLYVDGHLAASQTELEGTVAVNAGAETWLGGVSHNSRHAFTGTLDEVQFYATALPAAEVRQQAKVPASPSACETPMGRGTAPVSEPEAVVEETHAEWITYPNPTTGRFTLAAPQTIQEQIYVQVLNLQGQVVYTYLGSLTQRELAIDLTNESAGMYLVQVRHGQTQKTLKVQVE
ncbi:MAG: LamG-like jellyroll fold domain-containing protein, partial [Bacteroidota bacterium]